MSHRCVRHGWWCGAAQPDFVAIDLKAHHVARFQLKHLAYAGGHCGLVLGDESGCLQLGITFLRHLRYTNASAGKPIDQPTG